MSDLVAALMEEVKAKNPSEPEFHQAVQEVAESLVVVLDDRPEYRSAKVLERIIEPERVILFRVPWMDDRGEVQIQRGLRIEMNSAIGPYKGGHESTSEAVRHRSVRGWHGRCMCCRPLAQPLSGVG